MFVTANIAEGYGRYHFKENVQCCRIARGSGHELIDHLITCQDEQYVTMEEAKRLRQDLFRFLRTLNGYIRSIGASANRSKIEVSPETID